MPNTETQGRPNARAQARRRRWVVFLIRWWIVGAIYFFIGWGTPLGRYTSLVDLIFFLGVTVGLLNGVIINPALRMLYGDGNPKTQPKPGRRFLLRLGDVALGFTAVLIIMLIYEGINRAAVQFFGHPEGDLFLPGEPVLFGLFYAAVAQGLSALLGLMKKRKFVGGEKDRRI